MAIPRISYEGMDQTTKNAVLALQGYIAELEGKLNNMNRATNSSDNSIGSIDTRVTAIESSITAGLNHSTLINRTASGSHPASAITDVYNVPTLWVREEQASGTNGGGSTSGSYIQRTLNAVKINTITGASLSSNDIVLPTGTYKVFATSPGYQIDRYKIKLYNKTDSSDALLGKPVLYPSGVSGLALLEGAFTITSQKTFGIYYRCQTSIAVTGLGIGCGFGDVEIFSEVFITKLA